MVVSRICFLEYRNDEVSSLSGSDWRGLARWSHRCVYSGRSLHHQRALGFAGGAMGHGGGDHCAGVRNSRGCLVGDESLGCDVSIPRLDLGNDRDGG